MGHTTSGRRRKLILLTAIMAFLVPFFVSAGSVEACIHNINVTKQVVGERTPDPNTEFTIHVVGAEGVFDQTFQLVDGQTVGFSRVPPGTYVISEESSGADTVTFLVDGVPTDTLEVPATGADRTWEVVAVNDYVGARVSVEKRVVGNVPPPPDTIFEFELRPIPPTIGTNVSFSLLAGETWTSDWLPLGTYELVELNAPTDHTIVPNPITLSQQEVPVEVLVENPYDRGFIEVTKTETGETAPGQTYSFDVAGPVDFSFDLAAGDTWTSGALPYGTYTITEVGAPTGHTVVPNPVVLDAEGTETVQVLVTNPFRDFRGRLAIEKIETGDTAPGSTYTFDVTGPVDMTATVTAGDTWMSDWLPLGTYTVTEVGAPAGHAIVPNPAVLEIDGETVLVSATNPFRDFRGRLAIEKIETGDTAPGSTYTFDVTGPVDMTATVTAGDTWMSDWLPLGTYTVAEVGAPAGHAIVPNPAVLEIDGETVLVSATNPFRDFRGRLAIEKIETNGLQTGGTYTMQVSGPVSFAAQVAAGQTWTSDWLPLGTYTIVEVGAPANHTIVPNPAVLETDGETVLVIVTNTFERVLPETGTGVVPILVIGATLLVAAGLALRLAGAGRRRNMI